ncbi:MAG: secretion protein HlyD [Denitrovibrio sp.]|nr:MAG: secretion protein HlyD [Denitrovibrio sp.]
MKKRFFLLIIPIVIISLVVFKSNKMERTHPDGSYLFSGTAEVTEVKLSFKTSGRIKSVNFEEGESINSEELAATLDDTDEKLALSAAQANLAYSEASLAEVLAGSRKQEIRNTKAALDKALAAVKKADADLHQAKSDRDRFKKLYELNGVSKRTYELYETSYEKALHASEEAKAAERSAKESLSLAIEGARSEVIEKARAVVSISEQSVMQAKQKLKYTKLHSPISGSVITKTAEPGEFIQPGAVIMTVADISDMWVRGYLSETYLGKVKLGQKVILKSDSYPDKQYNGTITYISDEAEFTPKSVQTYEERINFMYMIKVSVNNSERELKKGMPLTGKIILE